MDNDAKQKIDSVNKYIRDLAGDLADNFADNKGLREELINEFEKNLLQNDLSSSEESLLGIISKDKSITDTSARLMAREASVKLSRLPIDSVRAYQGEDIRASFLEETIKNNPGITEEGIKAAQDYANEVVRILKIPGIEDQKDSVYKEFERESPGKIEGESPGKIENAFNDTNNFVKVLNQKPKQFEETISNHEKITTRLQQHNVKIPFRDKRVASYDRALDLIKNPEMRRFIESARSRFQTLERLTGRFSQSINNFINRIGGDRFRNIANNFFNKSIVQTSGGFASQIGAQTAKDFVQNSVGSILKGGLGQGMKSVMQGVMNKGAQLAGKVAMNVAAKLGLKSAVMNVAAKLGLKAALGAVTAGIGTAVLAGFEAIGKFLDALGLSITKSKMVDTVIIVVLAMFILIYGMGTAVADDVSSLKPGTEIEGGVGGPFNHGEITKTDDGRIRDCGVGMEADFDRNKNKTMVTPELLAEDKLEMYNRQLEETVGEQSGNRCGVVYAAHFLAYDFDYWVPYWFAGSFPQKGINPEWGEQRPPDENNENRKGYGLDCGQFRTWAWINGGLPGGNPGNSNVISFDGNCEKIKAEIEPGDGLFMEKKTEDGYTHSAIVLAYDNNYIKFAHSGGGSGVSTGLIDICTGKLVGGNMTFDVLQKKIYNDSNL